MAVLDALRREGLPGFEITGTVTDRDVDAHRLFLDQLKGALVSELAAVARRVDLAVDNWDVCTSSLTAEATQDGETPASPR